MHASISRLKTLLKQHGHSTTTARITVFSALAANGGKTMHQITLACPEIDRSSIYRVVSLFEQLDIAHRIYNGWKFKIELSDTFDSHHHHATCSRCGAVQTLSEDSSLEAVLHTIAAEHQFRVTRHQVELSGLCFHCQNSD